LVGGGVASHLLGSVARGMQATSFVANQSGRVFWSGGDIAKNAAYEFAKSNGMKTLEMTLRGRAMNSVGPYLPKSLTRPIWDHLSRNFAKGATAMFMFFKIFLGWV